MSAGVHMRNAVGIAIGLAAGVWSGSAIADPTHDPMALATPLFSRIAPVEARVAD